LRPKFEFSRKLVFLTFSARAQGLNSRRKQSLNPHRAPGLNILPA